MLPIAGKVGTTYYLDGKSYSRLHLLPTFQHLAICTEKTSEQHRIADEMATFLAPLNERVLRAGNRSNLKYAKDFTEKDIGIFNQYARAFEAAAKSGLEDDHEATSDVKMEDEADDEDDDEDDKPPTEPRPSPAEDDGDDEDDDENDKPLIKPRRRLLRARPTASEDDEDDDEVDKPPTKPRRRLLHGRPTPAQDNGDNDEDDGRHVISLLSENNRAEDDESSPLTLVVDSSTDNGSILITNVGFVPSPSRSLCFHSNDVAVAAARRGRQPLIFRDSKHSS